MKRADKRRKDELGVDIAVKEIANKKLVKSRLKWASHVERMGNGKLTKRAEAQKMEENGSKEDRDCDGKITLRQTWKEWEKNGEQEHNISSYLN